MSPRDVIALRDYLGAELKGRTISDAGHIVSLTDILTKTCLDGRVGELSGRSVLLQMTGQLISGLAMIEIDGVARRVLLCLPDLNPDYLDALIDDAEIEAVITDRPEQWTNKGMALVMTAGLPLTAAQPAQTERATEWLMLTSGTSGVPKIVGHTLEGLCGAIVADGPARGTPPVWATFYDVRRYGGLQIFLRAIIGGGSMVLSEYGEQLFDHVARLAARGVTHISGTPSHWRKLLMSGSAAGFTLRYVRLSGEIADQAVLDGLAQAFPNASIGHAYASTEAGVGFAVNDGREGFPASLVGPSRDGVEMKVVDGSLRIRSTRAAHSYVGKSAAALTDPDGFVDTGDMVELRGDRYYFVGRRGGIINIGGQKVHPEEVEAAINRHPAVWASLVRARKSPITGAIVAAEVVLKDTSIQEDGMVAQTEREIIELCRENIAPHKVPAVIRFVPSLNVSDTGKLLRHGRP